VKILMVMTSHDRLGHTGEKTGFWLEEFAAPYYVFRDAGADITLASPAGGQPPLDPKSDSPEAQTDATRRFADDVAARAALAQTLKLADVDPADYDAVFYPGGHGPLWDLMTDQVSIALIESMYAAGKPVAAVCHAPAVLLQARARDGSPLVSGKSVAAFSNTEEEAVGLLTVVPYLLETALKEKGATYVRADDWQAFAITDGNLITGQNPASSELVARAVLAKLTAAG